MDKGYCCDRPAALIGRIGLPVADTIHRCRVALSCTGNRPGLQCASPITISKDSTERNRLGLQALALGEGV